jgi:adenylate cyclase
MLFERNQLPELFATMDSGEELVTADTSADPRTAPLHAAYLEPLGCRALISTPALVDGKPLGAIWLELTSLTEEWQAEQISFARAIANMLALRVSAIPEALDNVAEAFDSTAPSEEIPAPQANVESKALKEKLAGQISPVLRAPARSQAFETRFRERAGPATGIHTRLCPDVSVLALAFDNPLALLTQLSAQQMNVVETLVERLESKAAELEIPYLRFAGDEFIAAAGFQGDTSAAAISIAELALAIRDICREIFTELGTMMSFKVGVDTGPVISTEFAADAKFHNIWGEAMTAARDMASTGLQGQIQVTESAYTNLRERYVFTVRGAYYLHEVGELTTLTLRSRI